jgi:hypothetical protein
MNNGFLKYFTIHLKNIIFFKFSLYCIVTTVLIWRLQIADNNLLRSSYINSKAKNSIAEAKIKLGSIANADKDILNSIEKYKQILQTTLDQDYNRLDNLKHDLHNIVNKYGLNEPANITITQFFLKNKSTRLSGDSISVGNYDVALHFMAQNFLQALSIIKECYSLMPENTVIISLELEDLNVLNLDMVNKLSTIKPPHLIDVQLIMRIREIQHNR